MTNQRQNTGKTTPSRSRFSGAAQRPEPNRARKQAGNWRTSIPIACGLLLMGTAAMAQKDAKEVYLEKCSICHGPDGAGKTAKGRKMKVKDVRETAPKVNAAEMIKIVEAGKGEAMDGYGKELSKDVIKAVVDYYRGLAK